MLVVAHRARSISYGIFAASIHDHVASFSATPVVHARGCRADDIGRERECECASDGVDGTIDAFEFELAAMF